MTRAHAPRQAALLGGADRRRAFDRIIYAHYTLPARAAPPQRVAAPGAACADDPDGAVAIGLGRIVALYHRSSDLYQIH